MVSMFFTLVFFLSVLVTSFISGVLGMAGGMILMGVLSLMLPVSVAMVLHGIIQMNANGFRAYLHKKHIRWEVLLPYVVGALVSFSILSFISYNPNKAYILITLGIMGILSVVSIKRFSLNILNKSNAFLCGVLVVCAQIFAGASGPVLDIFYYKSGLMRHEVVATKSMTQVIGHAFKIYFYGRLVLSSVPQFPYLLIPVGLMAVFIGTLLGKKVLAVISETQFLKYSRFVILLIACVYLYKGYDLLSERRRISLKSLIIKAEEVSFSAGHFDRQLKTGHVKSLIKL